MSNNQNLKELYKLFLINLTEKKPFISNKKQLKRCIENYLDKSILHNYESSYNTYGYIYDIECGFDSKKHSVYI